MERYPGLGLPLRYNGGVAADFYPIGAHEDCEGAKSDLLPLREVAMMNFVEKLTDKPDWHEKIFDSLIVSKWRKEALEIPDGDLWGLAAGSILVQDQYSGRGVAPLKGILTRKVFDHCINELRSKALYYKKSSILPTLDACASIAKSDTLVAPSLHHQLRDAFAVLRRDQMGCPDRYPGSNDITQDLMHPSVYPLVYGRSKAIQTTSVGVRDAINRWSGKGDVLDHTKSSSNGRYDNGPRWTSVPSDYWSETYQWLPANVAFKEDGSVKFTSYINNLHPVKYSAIYQTIESLITTALPAWDQCLVRNIGSYDDVVGVGAGRMHSRFMESMPENMDDENATLWNPSDPQETANAVVDWGQLRKDRVFFYDPTWKDDPTWEDETTTKWKLLRQPIIPDPATDDIEYTPDQESLAERFRKSGLQVIVKMTSIELTPEKPESPVGEWHVEGQMNERICATALYYVDSENVTSGELSFRMQTSSNIEEGDNFDVGQDSHTWLERIYGTRLTGFQSPCLQYYGSIETREGRLIAFPTVFQHRVSSFKLVDPTKPGHCRFIALWLVDPNFRIISTANVPPQQRDWWAEEILASTPEMREEAYAKIPPEILSLIEENSVYASHPKVTPMGGVPARLPTELVEMVRKYFKENPDSSLMGKEEANDHRVKLTEERRRFVRKAEEGWQRSTYSF